MDRFFGTLQERTEQSLEFVAETRILTEMKYIFTWKKSTSILFSCENSDDGSVNCKYEGTQLIFVMNFSVLHFCKFASRIPQIAQILVLTFTIFRRWEGEHTPSCRNFLFFSFSLTTPGSAERLWLLVLNISVLELSVIGGGGGSLCKEITLI